MTSIICSIPHPLDATSLYRGIGPIQTLKRSSKNIELILNPNMSWGELKSADMVFLQRPALDDRVQAMRMCKDNSKPIWVDYDDNLHAIPKCNRRFVTYGHPQIQHNIATMVALADAVTATTQHLADSLALLLKCFHFSSEYILDPKKIVVIPNAYDHEIMPDLRPERSRRAKHVMWRGSDSHCKDLMLYTPALADVVKKRPDYNYEFVGEPFWWTIEELRKVAKQGTLIVSGAQDPISFFRYMHRQKPALVIVPLEDLAFNRSKSNIAWIESTAAGAVTLAPKWDEWDKPGVLTYEGPEDFKEKMLGFLNGEFDADKMWKDSRDYIQENLDLRKVNRARMQVVEDLSIKAQA